MYIGKMDHVTVREVEARWYQGVAQRVHVPARWRNRAYRC